MTGWRADMKNAISDFLIVAELAGDPTSQSEFDIEYLAAPHHPGRLPAEKIAIYGFWGDGEWLKIGKAGAKSGARYTSHHYDASRSRSTLAGSLVADPNMVIVPGFDPQMPGEWIRQRTNRVNILLPATRRLELLSLLEAFLHVRLRPRYEG